MASPSPEGISYSMPLKSFVGDHHQQQQQIYNQYYSTPEKLEQLLSCLEKERLKIDGLKRELPLCMQLLNDVVETSRQQLQAFRVNNIDDNNNDNNNNDQAGPVRPVLEEFIPLKMMSDTLSDQVDKANWMTTAQLWSQESSVDTKSTPTTLLINNTNSNDVIEIGLNIISPPPNNNNKLGGYLDIKPRNGGGGAGGAFLPFSKERNLCPPSPVLALAPNDHDHHTKDMLLIGDKKCTQAETDTDHTSTIEFSCNKLNNNNNCVTSCASGGGSDKNNATVSNNSTTTGHTQTHRKARRCWSPDLHRRFVNALQMLGGSQVATPKQIRELMKVDGLTNDEVKSHLQKYRLHTRRPGPSLQGPGTPMPQLVVLGSIWVPPDYSNAAAVHGGAPLYGAHPAASHPPPPHFCTTSPVPQEFYTAATTPPLPPPASLPLHFYKPNSQTQSLPDSILKGNRERSESIEDGKSESSSCKDEW